MANIELDGANKKIKVDSGDLTLDIPGDIILDADGADLVFADGGTNILKITNSSSDVVLQPQVDAKDIIFKQYDGRALLDINDGGFVGIYNGATGPGQLRLYEDTDNGTNYSAFQVGTQSGDITYTLPTADGSNGHALTTNGSGTLSWASAGTTYAGIDDQSSSNDDQLTISDTAVIINEDSDSIDFRVESNGDANCLIVDGSADKVGIGLAAPEAKLHVLTGDASVGPNSMADELVIEGSGHTGMSILSGNSNQGGIYFGESGDDNIGYIVYNHSGNILSFATNAGERFRVDRTGSCQFGKTENTDTIDGFTIAAPGGASVFTAGDDNCIVANRQTNDGSVISIKHANSQEGNIAVSGSTVAYNTFCGTHWSRLADNSKPTILRGTVMESIATMCDWYQAVADVAESTDSSGNVTPAHKVNENIALPNGKSVGDAVTFISKGKEYTGVYVKEDNERLPMCKISNTADSKSVYGVFMAWDDNDDGLDGDVNDMYVAALGSFVVRIHKDETVAIGDYLQSKGDGTAKKQADDILRSSTIAKVTSTEKTHTYDDGSYCVPCTLHCG